MTQLDVATAPSNKHNPPKISRVLIQQRQLPSPRIAESCHAATQVFANRAMRTRQFGGTDAVSHHRPTASSSASYLPVSSRSQLAVLHRLVGLQVVPIPPMATRLWP